MIWALIRKDMRLLRVYLVSALLATLACYLTMGVLAVILTSYQEEKAQKLAYRALMTCMGGSNSGFAVTYFFAALLAGSVFTLERSDRSAEFLACLPPTRVQNLVSKLAVVLGATMMMIAVHLQFSWAAHLIFPFVRDDSGIISKDRLLNVLSAWMFIGMIVSVVGGAFAVSAWQNSNGVPILCGLLTPVFVVSILSFISWAMNVPSEADAFVTRFATASFVLGVTFGYVGCYWYLTRSES